MTLETFISTYGYAAIATGTFLEGETVLILGGLAAHQGYLSMPGVVASAFAATLIADQSYFYLGRAKGRAPLENRPSWKAQSEKVFTLLHRHQTLVTLCFRFLYGLRILVPFVLGASRISRIRFLVLNIIGTALWVTTYGMLGFLFGHTLDEILGNMKRYEGRFFLSVTLLGLLLWALRRWHWKGRTAVPPPSSPSTIPIHEL